MARLERKSRLAPSIRVDNIRTRGHMIGAIREKGQNGHRSKDKIIKEQNGKDERTRGLRTTTREQKAQG